MSQFIGQRIVKITVMTQEEADREGWDLMPHHPVPVIHLENGVKIYPSQDDEGNGGGVLFASSKDGKKQYYVQGA